MALLLKIEPGTILHLEDEPGMQLSLELAFERWKKPYVVVDTAGDALEYVFDPNVLVFIVDLKLRTDRKDFALPYPIDQGEHRGVALIRYVRQQRPTLPIVVLTSYRNDPGLEDLIEQGLVLEDDVYEKGQNADVYAEGTLRAAARHSPSPPPGDPGVLAKPMERLKFGRYDYHFVRPVTADELARLFGDAGPADLRTASDDDWALAFHSLFQRCYYTAPHEMSDQEQDTWERMLDIVDFERYQREFPEPETSVGRVVAHTRTQLTVQWDEGELEEFSIGSLPGLLLIAKPGDIVEATLTRSSRDGIGWQHFKVGAPPDDTVEDFDDVPTVDDAPDSDHWPRRSR